MKRGRILAAALAMVTLQVISIPGAMAAGWRLTWDTRYRLASFRGYELDSIPVADVVTRPDGRLFTPDGIAVRIPPGSPFAMFFRPGEKQTGGPLGSTVDGVAWGLGIEGLSLHGSGRLAHDTGSSDWPGTEPSARLHEGYAQWATPRLVARAGRMHELSRLGFLGYDGAHAEARFASSRVVLATYGGWGLARGEDLPATSATLDPLNDFLPQERQLVWGMIGRWQFSPVQLGLIYQREVDPRADDFVSERIGGDALASARSVDLSVGGDFDIAMSSWGRAETKLAMRRERASAEIGWRRYAPHFPLWTIWGAFSPVPYEAWSANGRATVVPGLELIAGGEQWTFEETEANTPLVSVEDRGWRWSGGARWFAMEGTQAHGAIWREFGPGAASLGYEVGASYDWKQDVSAAAGFSWLRRPLELRFDESNVATWMMRVDWKPKGRMRASAEIQRVEESRERPDEAAFDWGHWRAALSTTVELDSGTGPGVPPAVLRIPELPK